MKWPCEDVKIMVTLLQTTDFLQLWRSCPFMGLKSGLVKYICGCTLVSPNDKHNVMPSIRTLQKPASSELSASTIPSPSQEALRRVRLCRSLVKEYALISFVLIFLDEASEAQDKLLPKTGL